MIFIIGGRGRLAQAIAKQYRADEVVVLSRATYQNWGADDSVSEITDYFAVNGSEGAVVYICSGLLDPRLPVEQLHAVNFLLPRRIIDAVAPLGMRVVTFGTAMERTLTDNPYVASKLLLGRFVQQLEGKAEALHVRIHTLYGAGEPSPFMFLGQILSALRAQRPFNMTLGRQLREYHHVDDDAFAIKALIDLKTSGIVELSHGDPVTLRQLAEAVFLSFGQSDLLRIGAIAEPAQENFSDVFERPLALKAVEFRETVTSVTAYMKTLVSA